LKGGGALIKDLQVAYEKAIEQTDGKIILDNYELKEGLYLRINPHLSLESNQLEESDRVLAIRKNSELDASMLSLRDWFLPRDFYCSAISANKFVDTKTKKLHNTNCLSLFMKLDTFIADDPQKEKKSKKDRFLLEDEWKNYINTFYTSKVTAADQKLRDITGYAELKKWLDSEERNTMRSCILKFLLNNYSNLIKWIHQLKSDYKVKNYARLFFEADEKTYEREYQIYVYPSIFLKNDFNVEYGDSIYGVPSYNVGLNSKKPYLKSRTKKSQVPLLVSPEEATLRKNLFSWLQAQKAFAVHQIAEGKLFGENDKNKANETIHLRLDGNGVVNYYEKMPFSQGNQLNNPFFMENIIQAREWADKTHYQIAESREPILNPKSLLQVTSQLFFKNYLHPNMIYDEPKIKSGVFPGEMLNTFLNSRQALYDFFFKGTDLTLRPMIDRLSQELIEVQLLKTVNGVSIGNLGQAFNLRLAWLLYFNIDGSEEKVQTLTELVQGLKEKFTQKAAVELNTDQEFYFTAGQLAYYLMSQSETKKKNFGLFEGVLRAKKPSLLKRQLDDLFMTYSHAISTGNITFKNAFAAIQVYPETKKMIQNEERDYLMAGILADNIFFQKKELQTQESGE
jgi:CRISPR-associated protein Csh1